MAVERINPRGLYSGGRYSHVVKVGNTLYVAGQTARDAHGNIVGKGDIAAQAEQVFRNLEACLASVGAGLKDLVKTTVLLTRPEDLEAFRRVRERLLPADSLPASTLIVVRQLAHPDYLLEIEAVAVVDSGIP